MNYKALIIGIFIVAISIIGASIAIGISHRDIEVEDNAYEAGLHFDQACRRKAELGWQVRVPHDLKAGSAAIPVEVIDRSGAPLRDATVVLELDHRGGHEVHTYRCAGNGPYRAEVTLEASGFWDTRVQVSREKDSIRFEDTVYVQ